MFPASCINKSHQFANVSCCNRGKRRYVSIAGRQPPWDGILHTTFDALAIKSPGSSSSLRLDHQILSSFPSFTEKVVSIAQPEEHVRPIDLATHARGHRQTDHVGRGPTKHLVDKILPTHQF
jgi:hypothetical protein